ncbi:MAG TPA: DUF362 domain-containing protein [bacterium]|nr:DUF362 domain-containing protein [bacterium]HOL47711.1 DUF362 domain-containing protein [bacterium]HPQ19067.1 DUF362 domain-containing protein [bacterium]
MKVGTYFCDNYDLEKIYKIFSENIKQYIDEKNVFKDGRKILLKPNLVSIRKPDENITTHTKVIEAIIKYLKNFNLKIFIGDNPGAPYNDLNKLYEITGINELANKYNIKTIKFTDFPLLKIEFKNRPIYLANVLNDFDYIINIPKLKTHTLTVLTGAVKNLFGFIPGMYKIKYHSEFQTSYDFSEAMIYFSEKINPKIILNIVDGIIGMEGSGPTAGDKIKLNTIIIGNSIYEVDYIIANLVKAKPEQIPSILISQKKGLLKVDKINIIANEIRSYEQFKIPKTNILFNILPGIAYKIGAKVFSIKPELIKEKCSQCFLCVKSCPVNAISKKDNYPYFDYDKCIQCFCCSELCPKIAIKHKESVVVKLYQHLHKIKHK